MPRFHETRGRGLQLVSPIYRACLAQPRASFRFNFEVTGLVVEGRRVKGVRGRDMRTGETRTLRASALILATGGFQSNLEALADRAGLPGQTLVATLGRYNALVASGEDGDFGRFGPGSDERPRPIRAPPYYAVQFFPLSRKSMGGVRIDLHARVVASDETPISGLYAAGELTGLAGINGRAGRVAGRTAVADLRRAGWQASGADPAATPSRAAAPASAQYRRTLYCQGCHNLEAAIAGPSRRGYSHFEKVHRMVLERRNDCVSCHTEMGRYRPGAHRIDRVAQIETCRSCHVAVER